ncbi:MAG TPA: hypothetical protein VFV34_16205, partial [Blastocatellia bacterium]|nr:hypothetical protein [Blastocatellia bacterium]
KKQRWKRPRQRGGNLVNDAPFQRNLAINFGNIDNLVNLIGTALSSPTGLNGVESESKTPPTCNASLGIRPEQRMRSTLRALPSRRDIGNMGKNIVRLPWIFNNDLAIFKKFRVRRDSQPAVLVFPARADPASLPELTHDTFRDTLA